MEPAYVSSDIWHGLSTMLRFFWLYLLLIVGFASNFLIAHAIIPSLVDSDQLPIRIARLRPLFYLGAFSILAIAVVVIGFGISSAGVVGEIYGRWWI